MIEHLTPLADWVVILPVVLALAGAALLLILRQFWRAQVWICLVIVLAILCCDAVLFARVFADGPLSMTMGRWLPPFGISFTADVLGAGFAFVTAVVMLLAIVFLESDVPERAKRDGIYPMLLLMLAGVSGAFLTGDLFNLYVWFEVMLVASFGLMVSAGNALQLDGTVKYGLLNFLGTTLFLAALGLLYGAVGTLNMADIVARAGDADPVVVTGIASLLLLAFGIKAAAVPVNAWLPASYHTPPAAISALLGGLLTKVGVYALLRTLLMALPESGTLLQPVIAAIAVATMVIGPLGAIAETNLRRAIGFMLIGGIGVSLLALAVRDQGVAAGSVLYIVHSMFTITALYAVAGLVEKHSGSHDTRQMGGLYAANSLLSVLFLVLILAMAGVPPFLGFWPKLLLLQGLLGNAGLAADTPQWMPLGLTLILLLNAFLTLLAGSRLWAHIFWRPRDAALLPLVPMAARERAFGMAGASLLTLVGVVLALWPELPIAAAKLAAAGLLEPAQYITATGLAP